MLILGIETSCDETAAAVLQGSDRLFKASLKSSVVASQARLHAKTGGVVPEVAARAHIENVIPVIEKALKISHAKPERIDAIAVTAGPGLLTSLRVGVDTANTIGYALGIPVIAINHMEAHVYSSLLKRKNDSFTFDHGSLHFPALALTVSGGHTELVVINGWDRLKRMGATLDDAAGEAFDKIAKLLGLTYPGGPALSKLAEKGNADAVEFPRPMMASKDLNFSFAGLKTAVLYHLQKQKSLTIRKKADIAASAQSAIIDVLVQKTLIALKRNPKVKDLLVGGGVAANKLLASAMKKALDDKKITLRITDPELTGDNAGMIALAGYIKLKKSKQRPRPVRADANWEIK